MYILHIYNIIKYIYTKFAPGLSGLAEVPVTSNAPLGGLLGLPAWTAGPAWASVLPVLAFRTPVGCQLDAKWTSIGRQVSAKLDCQNGCQCQHTS